MSKIILKNKKIYFNIFLNKKYFKSLLLPQFQTQVSFTITAFNAFFGLLKRVKGTKQWKFVLWLGW